MDDKYEIGNIMLFFLYLFDLLKLLDLLKNYFIVLFFFNFLDLVMFGGYGKVIFNFWNMYLVIFNLCLNVFF